MHTYPTKYTSQWPLSHIPGLFFHWYVRKDGVDWLRAILPGFKWAQDGKEKVENHS